MNKDIYKDMGKRLRFPTMVDCLENIRTVYPLVYMEGSTGPERSFFVKEDSKSLLVGHAWQVKRSQDFWLRIADEPMEY